MARRIKSLFTFGLLNREKLLDLSKRDKLMAKKKFIEGLFGLESQVLIVNHRNHCVPDSGHIRKMILVVLWH